MASRSINKVQLLGNVTADLVLKYTTSNDPICAFSLATNRSWTTAKGEKKEETEFHRLVAWGKLAELCSQLLKKGSKVLVEGRLSTKTYKTAEGIDKMSTEIVIEDMIVLDSRLRDESEKQVSAEHKTLAT